MGDYGGLPKMLLSGEQINKGSFVVGGAQTSLRAASYDVRVGTIIYKDENQRVIESTQVDIPPSGMVEVISIEKIALPENVLGFATVKTGLSDKCVLATGIGLIDPGWDSFISSTLVNFGATACPISRGDAFVRLTFHEFKPAGAKIKSQPDAEYLRARREKVVSRFSDTFLNLRQVVRHGFRDLAPALVTVSAIFAVLVAILTAAITVGIGLGFEHFAAPPQDAEMIRQMREDNYRLNEEYRRTQDQLKQILDSQQELRRQLPREQPPRRSSK